MNKTPKLSNLAHFEMKSDKAIAAKLSKKNLQIKLEQPVMDILESLPTADRLSLIRRAIAQELVKEGLLDCPQN